MRFTPPPSRRLGQTVVFLLLLLAGCADLPASPPRVERLSAEQVEALLPQPTNAVTLGEIIALSRVGTAPAEIIRRIDVAHARYRLSATQLQELQRDGVALAVLDHLVAAERRGIFDDVAADLAKREQACQARIELELRQCRLQSTPMCWPPAPGFPFWRCF